MNLSVLKRSRRAPNVGDIFVLLAADHLYLYGRVIATDVNAGGFPGSNLVYIYSPRSRIKHSVPVLQRGQLLVAPIMTNNLPWTRGYFELIENRPLSTMDRLRQHCFRDSRGWYFDEYGNQLQHPVEPVATGGCTVSEL